MKNRVIFAIVICLVLILSVALTACGESGHTIEAGVNLLANGNMEQSGAHWTVKQKFPEDKTSPKYSDTDADSTEYDAKFGRSSVTLIADSRGDYVDLKQTVRELEHGATYRLSADCKVTAIVTAEGTVGAFIGIDGYTYISHNVTNTKGEWEHLHVEFVNDARLDELTVVVGLGTPDSLVSNGTVIFDNVVLEKINPDGVIALNLKDGNRLPYNTTYRTTVPDTIYTVLVVVLSALLLVVAYMGIRLCVGKSALAASAPTTEVSVAPKSSLKANLPILIMVGSMLVAFAIRLVLATTIQGHAETDSFMRLVKEMLRDRLDVFYFAPASGTTVYLTPGTAYFVYLLGLAGNALKLNSVGLSIFLKIPAILADLVLIPVVCTMINRKYSNHIYTLIAGMVIAILPISFMASAIWGSYLSVALLFLVLAFYAVRERKIILLTVFYTLAVLFSAEALLLLPLLIVYALITYVKAPETRIAIPVAATVALIGGYILSIPLTISAFIAGRPFLVLERYCTYFASSTAFSTGAFNIYAMCGVGASAVDTAGKVMSALFAAAVLLGGAGLYFKNRNRQNILLIAGWTMLALYVLCVRMDAIAILFAIGLLLVYALQTQEKRVMWSVGALSVISAVNLSYMLFVGGYVAGNTSRITIANSDPVSIVFSALLLITLGFLTYVVTDICVVGRRLPVMSLDLRAYFARSESAN